MKTSYEPTSEGPFSLIEFEIFLIFLIPSIFIITCNYFFNKNNESKVLKKISNINNNLIVALGTLFPLVFVLYSLFGFNPFNLGSYLMVTFSKASVLSKQSSIAIITLNDAIKHSPEYADAYYWRGIAKEDLKDSKGAIADFNKVIQLKPDDAVAYYWRGKLKMGLDGFNDGISDFNTAIELKPGFMPYFYIILNKILLSSIANANEEKIKLLESALLDLNKAKNFVEEEGEYEELVDQEQQILKGISDYQKEINKPTQND